MHGRTEKLQVHGAGEGQGETMKKWNKNLRRKEFWMVPILNSFLTH